MRTSFGQAIDPRCPQSSSKECWLATHLLPSGARQYLSFHLAGDMPDSRCLFIEVMDHAVCAIGKAVVASVPHQDLMKLFDSRPKVGAAIWRETLIDTQPSSVKRSRTIARGPPLPAWLISSANSSTDRRLPA